MRLDLLEELSECFISAEFSTWLGGSNNLEAKRIFHKRWGQHGSPEFQEIRMSALRDIFEVLIVNPEADYFWYNWDGRLTWSMPTDVTVPGDSIMVDRNKVRALIRNIKIETLGI